MLCRSIQITGTIYSSCILLSPWKAPSFTFSKLPMMLPTFELSNFFGMRLTIIPVASLLSAYSVCTGYKYEYLVPVHVNLPTTSTLYLVLYQCSRNNPCSSSFFPSFLRLCPSSSLLVPRRCLLQYCVLVWLV